MSVISFEWDDSSADIGHYRCNCYEIDDVTKNKVKIDDIYFTDYTNAWQQKDAIENHYYRPCAFEVSWCHGWSMNESFGYDKDYRTRKDENGNNIYGYNGTCDRTVNDIKTWCEEWIAQRHINNYEKILAELEELRQRAESFKTLGYGKTNLKEDYK